MNKTKITHPNGFYIFESKVCAKNNYIENLNESKILLTYINYFLSDYLIIHDYIITRHGFQIAIKLKDQTTIRSLYVKDKKKLKSNKTTISIWKIISERIRLCLSTYVKRVNKLRGRTGVLVHGNYSKYFFTSLKEAKNHLNKMRNQLIRLYQRKKKYRGLKKHYRISQKIAKGSIFLCSKELKKELSNINYLSNIQSKWASADLVLTKMVLNTYQMHNTLNHTLQNIFPNANNPPNHE